MNTPTEENNLPLFKYSPEIASQFLIQTNESQELVQIPNICDDLLLTELDGTITWTLGGLPILLNNQSGIDSQTNEEPAENLSSGETLRDILDQGTTEDQFVDNNAENSEEVTCPLTISDKNFLTDNNLFVTNEQAAASPNCDLINKIDNEVSEESSESEIQSSDISSQEAFIDINGLLISEQSVLNCPDLLFNIHEPQNSSNVALNDDFDQKNKKTKPKHDSVSDIIQNFSADETENTEKEVFNYDESMNSLIKVMNVNLFDKSVSKDTSSTIVHDGATEFQDTVPVDDEPDSTVTNDTEDSLNIDELATIITAYQCKKCDFTCNDRDQFLIHFKNAHLQAQPDIVNQIYEVQPDLEQNNFEEVQNTLDFRDFNLYRKDKRLKLSNDNNISTISILCTNGEIPLLNTGILTKNEPLEEATAVDTNTNLPDNFQNVFCLQENVNNEDNIKPNKFVFTSEEFPGITIVEPETEKKIMRVKKRKKQKLRVLNLPREENYFVSKFLFEVNPVENSAIIASPVEDLETEKQLIYLCSQCADQFVSVEDCRAHMIEVHKLCAAESAEKSNFTEEIPLPEKKDPVKVTEDKNKKLIDKILGQDALKSRRHKCPIKGCPYRFAKLELLTRHETCHVDGHRSQFRCPECGETQSCWRTCSIHLWRCHQLDLDLYACPLCNYRGSTSVKLKHHIKIHSDDREYICPDCGRGFKQPSQLRNHRVIHLENQPSWYSQKYCDKCGKMFSDSKCLKKHIQAVHSKLKPFICNVCGHSCARKAMLQMHLRQHTGEKPYSCSICLYKTGDHNSLRRHNMRHSGARPYKCPHCDYTAIQSNSYKNHLASKHPGMSGAYNCKECTFKSVNEEVYMSHLNDHKNNLIDKKKPAECNEVTLINLLNVLSNSSSEMSSSNENEIFAGSGGTVQINITSKKNIDLEDDETQNCFLSLSDLTDEQTVDTGGITIPADDPEPINM